MLRSGGYHASPPPRKAKMAINFSLLHWENWPELQLYRVRKFATGGPQKQQLVDIDRGKCVIFKNVV